MDDQVDERLYPCTKCKRKFVTSGFLQAHERTHARAYEHTHSSACNRTHTRAHERTHTRAHEPSHTRTNELSHTRTNEHTHTRIREHMHTSLRPYECNVCQRTFKQLMDMLVHQSTHEDEESPQANDSKIVKNLSENVYITKQSSVKSPGSKELLAPDRSASKQREIRIIEIDERPYLCLKCNKQFKNKLDRQVHECTKIAIDAQLDSHPSKVLKHLGNNQVKTMKYVNDNVDIKNRQGFVSSQDVQNPGKSSRSDKCFPCTTCSKQYTRMEHLRRHLLSNSHARAFDHSCMRSHVCVKCDKKFASLQNLKVHELTHAGVRPYGCKSCPKRYTQLSNLIIHQRLHTGERPYAYTKCDKTFYALSGFRMHSLVHTGEKKNICKICSKSFINVSKLRRHELIHTRETPFKCEQCEKQFRHKHSLVSHEQDHSSERPYVCLTCNKRFINVSDLDNHGKGHKKVHRILEHSYSHLAIGKISSDAASLSAHRRVHTKKRSHKCNVCAKSFCKPSLLRRHELVHYRNVPYKCSKCELRFSDKAILLLHERCHREEEDEILRASFMSLSPGVDWRWCKGVHTQRVLSALSSTPVFICTNCNILFRKRISLDNHRRVSCIVTYDCGTCGDVSDSITSSNNCFNFHHESNASSSVVSDVIPDINHNESVISDAELIEETETNHDECVISDAEQIEDIKTNHDALVIDDVTLIEVKEEKSIFTPCANNNIIIFEHAYALNDELLCKIQL